VALVGLSCVLEFLASRTVIGVAKPIKIKLSDANVNLINIILSQRRFLLGLGPMLGSFLAIGIGMRIWKFLNVSIILLGTSYAKLMGNSSNAKNSVLVPAAGLDDSDNTAGLDDVSIVHSNKGLIGGLGVP
jgi:hypothetical protein